MWPNKDIDLLDGRYWLRLNPAYSLALRAGDRIKTRLTTIDNENCTPYFDIAVRPFGKEGNIKFNVAPQMGTVSLKTRKIGVGILCVQGEAGVNVRSLKPFFGWKLTTKWSVDRRSFGRKESFPITKHLKTNMWWSANVELPEVSGSSETAEVDFGNASIDIVKLELSYDVLS